MERSRPTSGRPATPADINRNGRPTSIGTGGRHRIGMPGRLRRNPQPGSGSGPKPNRSGRLSSRAWSSAGLEGVKLVISDAHDGLRDAMTRALGATWQRCRVHWMRNALAHVPKGQHTMVAAAIRQAFLQPNAEAAHQTPACRRPAPGALARARRADRRQRARRPCLPRLSGPAPHQIAQHQSAGTPQQRGQAPGRCRRHLSHGAVLLEQNDEWLLQCRYMQIEGMAELTPPLIDADPAKLPPIAA